MLAATNSQGTGQPALTDLAVLAVNVDIRADGNFVANARATFSIADVAPTGLILDVPPAVVEGDTVTFTGRFTDPGLAENPVVTLTWSDGASSSVVAVRDAQAGTYGFASTRKFADDGLYTVQIKTLDKDGVSTQARSVVTVANVAPSMTDITIRSVPGSPGLLTVSGRIDDVGVNDLQSLLVDWGDGSAASAVSVDQVSRRFTASHDYAVNGQVPNQEFVIRLTASDQDNGASTTIRRVAFGQVAPVVSVTSLTPAANEGGVVSITGQIDDPNPSDTHQVTIVWVTGRARRLRLIL